MLLRRFRTSGARASAFALAVLAVPLTALAQPDAEPPADAPQLSAPKLVEGAEPEYPESKKAAHESAQVALSLTIDDKGAVTAVEVTSSAGEEFDAAAVAAARRLKFEPATRNGQPISARIPFRFDFAYAAPEPPPAAKPAPAAAPAAKPAAKRAPATSETPEVTDLEIVGERAPREVTRRGLAKDEIQHLPGTNGDALRSVESMPGVARPPEGMGLLMVRGSAPQDTAIFVDGTAVPIAYHFGGLNSVLPSELLERIDFYPGNFGPEYGRALGGVIDIGLRSPKRDRFHGLLQLDLIDGRLMAEGPIGDRTRLLVAGRRSWIDAWIGGVVESDGSVSVTKAPAYYDYQAVVEHDFSKSTTARLAFFGSDDRMAMVFKAPDPKDPSFGGNYDEQVSFQRLQLRTDTRFGSDTRWLNTLSVGRDHQAFDLGSWNLDLTYEPVSLRSDVRSTLARGVTMVGGLDIAWSRAKADYVGPPITEPGDTPGPLFGRPSSDLHADAATFMPAAYAMLELSPTSSLKLMPGVRADYSSDIDQAKLSPRFSGRWDVVQGFPRTTLKGGVGLYHQQPQPYQSIAPFGTSKLSHEKAIHYGLGVEQELSRNVELSVDGFYKKLDDIIVQRADAKSPSGSSYQNSASGRAYGAEVLLRYKADDRFFGWVAYTLSRSEQRDRDGEKLHLVRWDQTHILTALASYKLGRGWQLGARWRYVSGNPYTPAVAAVYDADAGAYQASDGALNSARTPAFHRLDLRVDKTWTFESWKLTAYLDVQNAYNRKNPEGQAHNYNYSRSDVIPGLPILPIVGVRGEL